MFSRPWTSAISRFRSRPCFPSPRLGSELSPSFVDSWQMPNWMMNVPLSRCNWGAASAIGCRGLRLHSDWSGFRCGWQLRPTIHLSAHPQTLFSPRRSVERVVGGRCSANHNKLCKRGPRLTIWTRRYCSGLILTQDCLTQPCPVLVLFFWPDKAAMKINDPTLTDSGGNWRAKEVVYHPVTGAIQSRLPTTCLPFFLLCFSFHSLSPLPKGFPFFFFSKRGP